jgi:hypothetical protein
MENQETSPSEINVLIVHNDKKIFRLVKDYLESFGRKARADCEHLFFLRDQGLFLMPSL